MIDRGCIIDQTCENGNPITVINSKIPVYKRILKYEFVYLKNFLNFKLNLNDYEIEIEGNIVKLFKNELIGYENKEIKRIDSTKIIMKI